jgi:uncharacterized protein (TIRG00374 family)
MDISPTRRKMPSWLPQVAGYCLSAGCLAWVLRGYPTGELLPTIRSLDWRWVTLAVAADLLVYVAHAWRWNTLLAPVARLSLWRTVQAIYIGLFANEVLPLRTGEVIRCYLLAHWNDLRISLTLASAAVERLIDGIFMMGAFLITASFVGGIPRRLTLLVQVLGALLLLGAVALAWIVFHKQHVHAAVSESRWAATFRHIVEGLHLMGNPRTIGWTSLLSLLYLALQVASVYALMKAYGLDLSFWVAGGVLSLVRFATVVPNAPGNVGLVQVACVLALGLFDVEKNDAKTFSFLMFAAWTLPLLAGGAIALALAGVNLGDLRDRAKRGIHAAHLPVREKR